jgi:NADH-quinone oxidoreductase subunit L
MLDLVWLIPAFPLVGFVLLVFFGGRISLRSIALLATVPTGLSTILALVTTLSFVANPPAANAHTVKLWTWLQVGPFAPDLSFYIDPLSIVMVLVVCFVGFFINLYSTGFMANDEGYSRFFAYMNLFVCSMLILVLAENLLFLYLGWEAVGLCSYLLIGFWYKDPQNGLAAIKAFVVTRVGDASLAIGLFLIFFTFGTLSNQRVMAEAQNMPAGSMAIVAAAALILGGAIGKSAQLPLQTWLPDAMAGPTPVSALIHAATMVTAGVYLIARTHVLFVLAPQVQLAVAVIGAATLVMAGCSALAQRRIKRVLAYSTISQIGYMFLALGVGAWSAAIFHFMTHAFFKALLFLSAGVVIQALNDEHDLFKMGGLRKSLPVTFWTFLAGAASLAALPFVTAGFYSKDLIINAAWSSPRGGVSLWLAGVVGAFLTALYAFRMFFMVFFGQQKTKPERFPTAVMKTALVVFAVCAVLAGFVQTPGFMGNINLLGDFLSGSFVLYLMPRFSTNLPVMTVVTSIITVIGIVLACLFFLLRPFLAERLARRPAARPLHAFWASGWGFDWLYDLVLVRPFLWFARVNRSDAVDLFYRGLAWTTGLSSRGLALSQSGKVRWYAMGVGLGALVITGLVIFL